MPPIPTARAAANPRIIPFALPQLHVGTDICHVTRVYAILGKPASASSKAANRPQQTTTATTTAARFVRRVLTPREVKALGPAPPVTSPHPPTMSAHAAVAWLARGHALPVPLPGPPESSRQAGASTGTPNVSVLPDTYSPLWRAAQYLAGRFAAKEAAIKAHPHLRGLTLQDVRIARHGESDSDSDSDSGSGSEGGPSEGASEEARDYLARKGSGPPLAFVRVPSTEAEAGEASGNYAEQEARISISHDGEYATAVCLGFEHAV